MKLLKIKPITGKITLKSGLHIGAGDMEMKIGGTDNPVIKHPHTLEPFIPGSSLKGKVRSLLEMRSGLMKKNGGKPLSPSDLKKCTEEEKKEGKKIGSPYKTMQVRKISYLRGIGTVMRYLQFSGKFVSPICIAGVLWLYFFINFSFLLLIRIRKLL